MKNCIILPSGTMVIGNDNKTFTLLAPATGNRHFLKCHICGAIEAHTTELLMHGTVDHTCISNEEIHSMLESYITEEMIESEEWRVSSLIVGYEVSNLGRIRNLKGRILKPSSSTEEGRIYYVIREESLCHLRFIEEFYGL